MGCCHQVVPWQRRLERHEHGAGPTIERAECLLATTSESLEDDAASLHTLGALEGDESSRSYYALVDAFGVADSKAQRSTLQALIARKLNFDDRLPKCQA